MSRNYTPRAAKKIFLTLRRRDNSVYGSLTVFNKQQEYALDGLNLHPSARLAYGDQKPTLQDVLGKFLAFDLTRPDLLTNERGQLDVGHHLFSETFKVLSGRELRRLRGENIDLRVVTDDEHIMRLPWSLIADGGIFLSTSGWSVSLSAAASDCKDYTLPPSPKILVITPKAPNWQETIPDQHVAELEERLSGANHLHKQGRHLRWVTTWEETLNELRNFQPHIIYYYGHGMGDFNSSELVFTSAISKGDRPPGEPQLREKLVPAADFASAIRRLGDNTPLLAYINCCLGDAGGLLGVGRQLSEVIPAVVTNCTTAYREAAQKQALAFLKGTLLDGLSPHEAVSSIRANMVDLDLTFRDLRWLTPVLHSRYLKWSFTPPPSASKDERDLQWRHRLNRVHQFSQVLYQTRRLIQGRHQRSLAYVWYGREGQGLQQFYQRIEAELPSDLPDFKVIPIRPSWPIEYYNFSRSVGDMLAQAFGICDLEELPAKIDAISSGGKRQIILYLQHPPITPEMNFSLGMLRWYLEWLDHNFAGILPDNVYGLTGFSFMVRKPETFKWAVLERERLNEIEFENISFHLLEEMKSVERSDLVEFLRSHNIRWPSDRREELLNRIITRTGGSYEGVLEEIKALDELAWDLTADAPAHGTSAGESDYDYN